jgi:hypothetical protein
MRWVHALDVTTVTGTFWVTIRESTTKYQNWNAAPLPTNALLFSLSTTCSDWSTVSVLDTNIRIYWPARSTRVGNAKQFLCLDTSRTTRYEPAVCCSVGVVAGVVLSLFLARTFIALLVLLVLFHLLSSLGGRKEFVPAFYSTVGSQNWYAAT